MHSTESEIQLWPLSGSEAAEAAARISVPMSTPPKAVPLTAVPGSAGAVVRAEAFLNRQGQLRMLVSVAGAGTPQINGEPAPHLSVAVPGDQLDCPHGPSYRIVVIHRPKVGPPPAAIHGKPCPVCRVPFAPNTTCVVCHCGAALHCEPDAADGLQCAQLARSCPVCRRAIVLTETVLHAPADDE